MPKCSLWTVAAAMLLATGAFCQQVSQQSAPPSVQPSGHSFMAPNASYVLGVDDIIAIRATDAEDITDKAIRIGPSGFIDLSTVGRVKAAGLTTEELEQVLIDRLKPFIRHPEVSVNIVELHSQPVSVVGAVMQPGIHQLQGGKTLVEILSMAGGLRPDAGYTVRIMRKQEWGPIPLPNAHLDASGKFSIAEVDVKEVLEARNPAANILVMPNDVLSVPVADMIYVIGEVKRAGGYTLGEKTRMSVLQALSMAAGLDRTAMASKAKILRATAGELNRTEIPVNLQKILEGKEQDVALRPDDILFVPNNKTKSAGIKVIEALIQAGTGIAVYRGGAI